MEQNSLINLVSSFFSSPVSTESIYLESEQEPIESKLVATKASDNGLTGVARYLGEKPKMTGVAAYLDNKESLVDAEFENVTGVAKYLSVLEKQSEAEQIIAQYLKDQEALCAQREQEAQASLGTGVTRYLKGLNPETGEELEPEIMAPTGVSKYLEAQEELLRQEQERRIALELAEQARLKEEQEALEAKQQAEQEAIQLAERERLRQEQEALEAKQQAEQEAIELAELERQRQEQEALEVEQQTQVEEVIEQESGELANQDENVITGVAAYLNNNDSVSGVARYLAQQEIKPRASGVEKYLINKEVNNTELTGVDKYMVEQSKLPETTGVARYLVNQELEKIKDTRGLSKVEMYLQHEALLASKVEAEKIISKYLEEQRILSKQKAIEAEKSKLAQALAEAQTGAEVGVVVDENSTGVERYLAQQATLNQDKPVATGVARYIAKQIVENTNKPQLTGVAKFITAQEQVDKENAAKTGVERYLRGKEKETILNDDVVVIESGVSKYIESQKTVPEISGVEKYLLQQATDKKDNSADEAVA